MPNVNMTDAQYAAWQRQATLLSPEQEQGATAERQALAEGAEPGSAPELAIDPIKDGHDIFFRAIKEGATEDDALAFFINHRVQTYAAGDERVTVEYQEKQRRGRRFRVPG